MNIELSEKPKDVIIIQGFPGFGMVGSIATEFLIEHLQVKQIGTVFLEDVPPIIAIHKGKIIPPVGIYYNKDFNIVILSFLTKGQQYEWKFADVINELANEFEAKEIITIEGVTGQENIPVSYYSSQEKHPLAEKGYNIMQESIVLGVSAALLLKIKKPITALFANSDPSIPDSHAAAEIIKTLDAYLALNVDYNPLHDQAKIFEEKIQGLLSKSEKAVSDKNQNLNYVS